MTEVTTPPEVEPQADDDTALTVVEHSALARQLTTTEGLAQLKAMFGESLSDVEFRFFCAVIGRTGLDPFQRQIHAVKRSGRLVIQTGIDGYRLIAQRTNRYNGQTPMTWGDRCTCEGYEHRINFPHPEWAEVGVYLKGVDHPTPARAYFHEYIAEGPLWRKMPRLMIAKCAEALALRKAFPNDFNGIYTDDEMEQADNAPAITTATLTAPVGPDAAPPAAPAVVPPRPGLPRGVVEVFGACPTEGCTGTVIAVKRWLSVSRTDPSKGKRETTIVTCSTDTGPGKGCGLPVDWHPDLDRYRNSERDTTDHQQEEPAEYDPTPIPY